MNIVVLDGHTLNPGDLSWEDLQALGPCEVYDRTEPDKTLDRSRGAEILLTNKTVLDAGTIERLETLCYIGVLATGFNVVDIEAARRRGIPVTNVPDYGTDSVAQIVFAHLLHHTHHVAEHGEGVREGRWSASVDFCYWDFPLVELCGQTLGIVGFGRIGRAVARIASAFGMKVLVHTLDPVPDESVEPVDLETLFRQSDVVSLHCPLTPQTERLIDAERLGWMKPTALLINTGRGGLVDEPALAEALSAGRRAGAALDVLSVEPPPPDHPLFRVKNCTITPHIGWATRAARRRLMQIAVENVTAFLAGRPQNVVNGVTD